MQKLLFLLPLLLISMAFVSCGGADTHESLAEDMNDEMGTIVSLLEGITDADSANAAKDKLNAAAKRIAEIAEKGNALEKPDAETDKKLMEKFAGQDSNASKMMMELMRVGQIPGTVEALKEFGETLEKMQ